MAKNLVLAAVLSAALSTLTWAEDKPATAPAEAAAPAAATEKVATTPATTEAAAEKVAATPATTEAAAPVATPEKTASAPAASVDPEVVKQITEQLKPLFGSAPDSVKPTPIAGVYAVSFGMELLYSSPDGRYVFSGDLIDSKSRTNLSENARASGRKAVMDKADLSKTITFKAKGEEKYAISVFTDVSCPYCVKLHHEVPKLNDLGVTVHYFAYPRAGVGSGPYKQMVSAWCSADPMKAISELKDGKTIDPKDCTNPVADHYNLGQKVGVTGTPAIVTQDGVMIAGYRPAREMFEALEESKVAQ
ncbi:DsbC family protein [Thiofilum flexile]|uniref:DsbC family protein n=1 Tax=Thiofilum flexile TaxID=125627 RepID=UPI0003801C23|nr:DsbC family protein [Thiofilum flexile]